MSVHPQQIMAKVARHLVPFLIFCYFLSYLDRVNIGFAALTMNKDIGLSASAFGFGASIFFLGYFLFVAFMLYIRQHPFPGFAGVIAIVGVTMIYLVIALVVYVMVYGRNRNPLDTHAGRMHGIGVAVKSGVYTCIVTVAYLSLNFALRLLELQRWELFALSAFFVVCALLSSMGVIKPLRQPVPGPL